MNLLHATKFALEEGAAIGVLSPPAVKQRTTACLPRKQIATQKGCIDGNMIIAPNRGDLHKIVVLNPKGGCGKTTLATNLASYFALHGPPPTLIDNDPNGYTIRWLQRRPQNSSEIHGIANYNLSINATRSWQLRIPDESSTVIIDTPAAIDRHEIRELTYDADAILIPILPSAVDVGVTTGFIAELLLQTQFERPVAVVANRTRQNTNSYKMLLGILENIETPVVSVLRDSQNYLHAADLGLGIYELPHYKARKDVEQMDQVIDWLHQ